MRNLFILSVGIILVGVFVGILYLWFYLPQRKLSPSDLARLQNELLVRNDYPQNRFLPAFLYPQKVGIDSRNGLALQLIYSCSDICPDQGHISLYYTIIKTRADCEQIGGISVDSDMPSPGIFMGCKPNTLLGK